jgi:hypothetical protein
MATKRGRLFAAPGFELSGGLRPRAGALTSPGRAPWVFAQRKSGVVLVLPGSCAFAQVCHNSVVPESAKVQMLGLPPAARLRALRGYW